MGCFNDLPKDLKWLIFRASIINTLRSKYGVSTFVWEVGDHSPNPFHRKGKLVSCYGYVALQVCKLATLNKDTLRLVRSKCFKTDGGWFFIKGALTSL